MENLKTFLIKKREQKIYNIFFFPPIVLLLSAEQHWSWCCVNAGVGLTEPCLMYLPHTVLHHIAIAACSVCGQESLHCAPE